MKKSLNKNHLVLITGFLYTITALIVVLSAWIVDLHRYDLRLTISIYVALRPWTAILYLIVALAMEICIFFYIKKTQMPPIRKIIYGIIFLCVLGCAVFPCNGHWSVSAANIHNAFAYGLMLVVTVSFITMLIMSKPKQHKIFSVLGICYATFFIVSYVIVGFHFFIMTLFIWENAFIYLLLIQLYLEKYND